LIQKKSKIKELLMNKINKNKNYQNQQRLILFQYMIQWIKEQ